jgi:hypothetical protein
MDAAKALETFRCDRQAMTLTRGGCARLWLSAQEKTPKQFEGRWHCRACPIGAAHAGREAPQQAADTEAAKMRLEGLCPSCERTGQRIIVSRGICVSCYNRRREVAVGRNRKGNAPKVVASRLGDVTLVVARADAAHAERATAFRSVTGAPEAMLAAARRAKGASLVFSRPVAVLPVAA